MTLLPLTPNWRQSVTVEFAFRTDVMTSRSGREQRRALRGTPRKSVSYSTTVSAAELRKFQRFMATQQNQPLELADPTRSAPVTVTGTSATVYPVPEWLIAGAKVVLGDQVLTVIYISDIGETTFNIDPIAGPTRIRPALSGQLGQSVSATMPTNGVAIISVAFDVTPGSEHPNTGLPGIHVFAGREVFTRRCNWASAQDLTYDWSIDTLDFGFGKTAISRPIDFGTVTRKATFVQQGPADMLDLEQFFQRQKGQQGEFYMPTGQNDLPLLEPALAGSQSIKTAGTEVFEAYTGDTVYQAIAIFFHDDRIVFRHVDSLSTSGSDTVLLLDRPFATDITLESVSKISWLTCSRFASDQFTQEWLSDGVAQSQLAVTTLEDLPVEGALPYYDGAAEWLLETWGPAALTILDEFDYLVNIAYPAVWFIPEARVAWRTAQAGINGLDYLVNVAYPGVFD